MSVLSMIGIKRDLLIWSILLHPSVFMAHKEIHFFDKDYNYSQGLSWYARFFAGVTNQSIVAEKTPEYLWANGRGGKGAHSHSPEVHRRLRSHFPEARFIVVLRDPVQRAISAFNHMRSYGYFPSFYSIESVLFGGKRNIGSAFGILEKGLYAEMLEAFFDLFTKERFLVLEFEEDLCRKPRETMKSVCDFLGLPAFEFKQLAERENQVQSSLAGMWAKYCFPRFKRVARYLDQHLPAHKVYVADSVRTQLQHFYKEPNESLFALLQKRFRGWV